MASKATFGQKYVELQFDMTPADSSQVKVYTIISLAIGFFTGGVVMKVVKFKAKGLVRYNLIGHLSYMILFLLLAFLPGCTPQSKEGFFGFPERNESLASSTCDCYINTNSSSYVTEYNPMCVYNFTFNGEFFEEKTVINPCLSGCTGKLIFQDFSKFKLRC